MKLKHVATNVTAVALAAILILGATALFVAFVIWFVRGLLGGHL